MFVWCTETYARKSHAHSHIQYFWTVKIILKKWWMIWTVNKDPLRLLRLKKNIKQYTISSFVFISACFHGVLLSCFTVTSYFLHLQNYSKVSLILHVVLNQVLQNICNQKQNKALFCQRSQSLNCHFMSQTTESLVMQASCHGNHGCMLYCLCEIRPFALTLSLNGGTLSLGDFTYNICPVPLTEPPTPKAAELLDRPFSIKAIHTHLLRGLEVIIPARTWPAGLQPWSPTPHSRGERSTVKKIHSSHFPSSYHCNGSK